MSSIGVGLLLEEHRGEIAAAWRTAAAAVGGDPALGYAVAPLLRELSLAMRDAPASAAHGAEAIARVAVLVRSAARPPQLARELKLLHRAIWDALRASGEPVGPDERLAVDAWLLDALAECLERVDRVRARIDTLERSPDRPARPQPPPLPRSPPPLR